MSKKTYVIRGYHFGYNDEFFYVCGSRVNSIYHSKRQAVRMHEALEVRHARNADLSQEQSLFHATPALVRELDCFVFGKTGRHIAEDGRVAVGVQLPPKMGGEDVMEFIRLAEMHAYTLVTFEEKAVFHTLWDTAAQEYQHEYDEYYTGMVYAESRAGVTDNLKAFMKDKGWRTMELDGALEDLTRSPVLLRRLIETTACLAYDHSRPSVIVENAEAADLAALNELLKKPLFEVRELSPQEVVELEKLLPDEDEEFEVYDAD